MRGIAYCVNRINSILNTSQSKKKIIIKENECLFSLPPSIKSYKEKINFSEKNENCNDRTHYTQSYKKLWT